MKRDGLFCIMIMVIASLFVFTNSLSFDLFATNAVYNSKLNNGTATFTKIAYDQSVIMIGFSNGAVQSYNFFGSYINQFIGHNNSIIDIQWIPGSGPLTLDSSGKVIKWDTNGNNTFSMTLGSGVTMMSTTTVNSSTYVGFNYGNRVVQYLVGNSSWSVKNTYNAVSGTSIRQILYSSSYQYLFIGTNTSKLQFFTCSSGAYSNSSFSLNNQSNVLAMSPFGSQTYVLLTTNSQIFKFNTSFGNSYLGNTSVSSSTMTTCPTSLWMALGEASYDYIDIYDSFLFRQQQLNYIHNSVKSMDCSNNYLVSIDNSNYLAVTKYDSVKVNLPGWAIGVIAGGVALIVIIVVIVIIIVVIRKRRANLGGQFNNTGQQMLSPSNNYNSNSPNHYQNQNIYIQEKY